MTAFVEWSDDVDPAAIELCDRLWQAMRAPALLALPEVTLGPIITDAVAMMLITLCDDPSRATRMEHYADLIKRAERLRGQKTEVALQ